jgi:hypothetical protein
MLDLKKLISTKNGIGFQFYTSLGKISLPLEYKIDEWMYIQCRVCSILSSIIHRFTHS